MKIYLECKDRKLALPGARNRRKATVNTQRNTTHGNNEAKFDTVNRSLFQ